MKSDEELKKTFEVFVDDNNIINITALVFEKESDDIARATELVKESLEEIYKRSSTKTCKLLIDLSPIVSIYRNIPTKARKACYQIAEDKHIQKAAVVTPKLIMKVLINFITTATGKKGRFKCFFTKKEALKWLEEK